MYKFRAPENSQFNKLIKYQTAEEIEHVYDICIEEKNILKRYIKKPHNALDLGCGLGRTSIFLKNTLDWDDTKFWLADFDYIDEQYYVLTKECGGLGYREKAIPHNKLDLTKEFCEKNNLSKFEIIDLKKSPMSLKKLQNIDVVYSFHSIGYHWPIKDTIKKYRLENITRDNAIFVFGVRNNKSRTKTYKEPPRRIGRLREIEYIEGTKLEDYLVYKKVK